MGRRTRMAYYADLLHATPSATSTGACTQEQALAALVIAVGEAKATPGEAPPSDAAELPAGLTPRGQQLAVSLSMGIAAQAVSRPPTPEESLAGAPRIIDALLDNPSPNNHAACGYLRASRVRSTVTAAVPTPSG